jgi:hypothetical protein
VNVSVVTPLSATKEWLCAAQRVDPPPRPFKVTGWARRVVPPSTVTFSYCALVLKLYTPMSYCSE